MSGGIIARMRPSRVWWIAPFALVLAVSGVAPSGTASNAGSISAVAVVTPDTIRPPLLTQTAIRKVAVVGSAADLVGTTFTVVDDGSATEVTRRHAHGAARQPRPVDARRAR